MTLHDPTQNRLEPPEAPVSPLISLDAVFDILAAVRDRVPARPAEAYEIGWLRAVSAATTEIAQRFLVDVGIIDDVDVVDVAPAPWYTDHGNLVRLTQHMATDDWPADEIARAVEKPWCYTELFQVALAEPPETGTS